MARAMRTLAFMHLAEAHGPPQHVRPWLAALAERGSLEVVLPGPGPAVDLYAPLGQTKVIPYAPLTFPRTALEAGRLGARLVRDVRTFRRHLRRARPDVVVIATAVLPAALIAARLERIPSVVYVGEILDRTFGRNAARVAGGAVVRELTQRLAGALVCCSQTAASQFERNGGASVVTVYPGVNGRVPAGDGSRFRAAANGDGPCLAVVGNITPGRGQDLVIRALPELQRELGGVHCLIAGVPLQRPIDIAFRPRLERLATELGVDDLVTFTGFVDPIADVYAAADIVVNPVRVEEAFGRVALEALVAGRPVVAARIGAIPELLTHERDALLVDPDDPGAIALAVRRLWQDERLRRRLVERGRERVLADFREESGVQRFVGVVEDVLRRAPNGRAAAAPE
jgi:glycosyltransferase involved in cell wall biosynthesis